MRVLAPRLLVLAVLAALPAAASAAPFTLEAVLSAPHYSELLASPAGGRIAWVQYDRGVRNVWVASPPDYRPKAVTAYTQDDGQAITNLEWTPDSRTLFYVRGSGGNRQGESPNPTSDPAGAEQAVWRVSADGSAPVRIGAGGAPAVSPKGDGVAFTQRGKIVWAPMSASSPDAKTEPAPIVQTRGGAGSLRWSPDGSHLAFVSNRGDHSFVGVYDLAAKTVRWLAPSVDNDIEPEWSPDGTRVAFLRLPAERKVILFHPNNDAEPWSILVSDIATGRTTMAWRADEGPGSAFQEIEAANQVMWMAGDRLVLPWEKDGWTHLYAVPATGGDAVLLTPGEFEIINARPTPDRREVLVTSNQGDIDRRHVWRVPVAGGTPVAITRGDGLEWLPAMTSDGKAIAFLRSGARKPARLAIRIGDGGEPRDLTAGAVPADFPENELVVPEPVIYSASDGLRIHAQLFEPRDLKPGERRPAVVFFHGGSHRQMLLGWHDSPYYNKAYALNQYLASRGYIVLSVNYRSGIGYGLKFREAAQQGASGASEFNDVLGAGLYLRSRPDVDPARIGLWGGSYGGYLTALGLARASDLFAAGVDLHGVHDWNEGIRTFVPDYAPEAEEQRLAFESSPMAWLAGWRSPVLLIHGDDDRNVSFSETVALTEELRRRKVDVETLILPDEIHSFLRHASWLAAYHAAADFFDRKLARKGS
jgi:dipeptidyl aminopeptidase/acylaminoacyl peptidase